VVVERERDERRKSSQIFRIALIIAESQYFSYFIAISIAINTFILSLDKYPENFSQTQIVEKMNLLFAVIFAFDLVIKLLAFGIKSFFKGSWFNTFDFVIVVASTIDIVLSNLILVNDTSASGSIFTALRGFRLLRIFKLAKQWKRFELLLETMGKSFKDIINFAVFLFLFIFIFTLMALELFAYKAKINPDTEEIDVENGVSPIYNFDNFMNSFSLVFIILTNDGQSAVYYNYYRAVGALPSTIFFVLLILIGQKVIINLFVAILLENFDESALKQKLHDMQEVHAGESLRQQAYRIYEKLKIRARDKLIERFPKYTKCLVPPPPPPPSKPGSSMKLSMMLTKTMSMRFVGPDVMDGCPEGESLMYFTKKNPVRRFSYLLVTNKFFEMFIMAIIIISAVTLALDGPTEDPNSLLKQIVFYVDIMTTVLFMFEAICKIIAFGFLFNGEKSYLQSIENTLDFLIIIFSIMAMTPLSDDFKTLKVLRIVRLINRNEGLKIAVRALFRALPNVINVTLIMILFFLIFGVILVSQFKGTFFICSSDTPETLTLYINTKWDCLNAGGLWTNTVYNFDNVPNALVTLFVMSTTAGWQDVLYHTITSTDID
jgi:Ion transport protein